MKMEIVFMILAKDLMSSELITIEVPNSRSTVIDLMEKHDLNELPVVKKGTKELVGIVSTKDLIRNASEDQLAMLMRRDLITLNLDTPLKEIVNYILKNNVSVFPVIDKKSNELLGVVSIEDIVTKAIAKMDINDPVKTILISNFTAVWEGTPLNVVPYIMKLADTSVIPVINEEGKLTGMISNEEIMKNSEIVSENSKSTSGGTEENDWSWDATSTLLITYKKLKLPNTPVKDSMIKNLITTVESCSISEAAKKMKKNDINQIPILKPSGKLIGIVTDKALLTALK
ncbi:MAG: CBS domain-containing protein [Candidatus Lokiarchaeota archaeon]|nr:CBS domain-containing protein [Candidatus Lokiarchaeota archaeon]